ncbi:uncharacterized protein LOC131316309 [Rhododendron vialii]|uniref:uncharacterized protein LOC131316309 n=1 Tax=Rhododendron vialii TaxID=182163 RepID=UPI00265E4B38|nr:uncharacterized protein LOC131316309 [Rhododendron vialii]
MGRKANSRRRREKKKNEIIPEERTRTEVSEPNFPDIPEEIVVDIRSRFPLKSLLRFTCVSKQWHSAISDILAERIGGKIALIESTFRSGSRPWNKKGPWSTYPKTVGSCNGLLIMRVHDDLFWWNPVTEYFKKVLAYAPLGDNGFRIASGLCYDSSAKE